MILATNVAETSLTVEGVTDVIDGGLHKVLRYDPARALDRLELERIPADSAEQRAGPRRPHGARPGGAALGRARSPAAAAASRRSSASTSRRRCSTSSPGAATRARSSGSRRRPPRPLAAALALLERLGAVRGRPADRRTARRCSGCRVHPRLARVLLSAGGGPRAAAACAVSPRAGGPPASGDAPTTDSDVLSAADRIREAPPAGVRAAARELERVAADSGVAATDARRRRAAVCARSSPAFPTAWRGGASPARPASS